MIQTKSTYQRPESSWSGHPLHGLFFAQPKKNPSSLYELALAAFELLQMIAKNEYSFEKHRLELHMNGS